MIYESGRECVRPRQKRKNLNILSLYKSVLDPNHLEIAPELTNHPKLNSRPQPADRQIMWLRCTDSRLSISAGWYCASDQRESLIIALITGLEEETETETASEGGGGWTGRGQSQASATFSPLSSQRLCTVVLAVSWRITVEWEGELSPRWGLALEKGFTFFLNSNSKLGFWHLLSHFYYLHILFSSSIRLSGHSAIKLRSLTCWNFLPAAHRIFGVQAEWPVGSWSCLVQSDCWNNDNLSPGWYVLPMQ